MKCMTRPKPSEPLTPAQPLRGGKKVSRAWPGAPWPGKSRSTNWILRDLLSLTAGCFGARAIFFPSREGYEEQEQSLKPGPLISWSNAADQWHEWSVAVLSARSAPHHGDRPRESVLACGRQHAAGARAARSREKARPRPGATLSRSSLTETQEVMLKYTSMDAADASLVVLAERSPRAVLITTDRRDFASWRGLHNRALKLILSRVNFIARRGVRDEHCVTFPSAVRRCVCTRRLVNSTESPAERCDHSGHVEAAEFGIVLEINSGGAGGLEHRVPDSAARRHFVLVCLQWATRRENGRRPPCPPRERILRHPR